MWAREAPYLRRPLMSLSFDYSINSFPYWREFYFAHAPRLLNFQWLHWLTFSLVVEAFMETLSTYSHFSMDPPFFEALVVKYGQTLIHWHTFIETPSFHPWFWRWFDSFGPWFYIVAMGFGEHAALHLHITRVISLVGTNWRLFYFLGTWI